MSDQTKTPGWLAEVLAARGDSEKTLAELIYDHGFAEGLAEARAKRMSELLLRVCDGRQLALSEEQRQRVVACTDGEQLDVWFVRAATADSATEVFAD